MKRLTQTGSHVVAVAFGLLVVGVVAFAGFTVMQRNDSTKNSDKTASSESAATDTIKTDADLAATAKTLDDSSTQLDNSLDDSSLDSDLNDLL